MRVFHSLDYKVNIYIIEKFKQVIGFRGSVVPTDYTYKALAEKRRDRKDLDSQ